MEVAEMEGRVGDEMQTPMAAGAKTPRVSVILPVRDGMPYLPLAVESILNQTFGDFELIIMDDASTDGTAQYLSELQDERVRVTRNQQNLGVARTLNQAVRLARGQYIARQDADDFSLPGRLEKQVAFLDSHPQVALLGSALDMINENGAIILPSMSVPCSDLEIKWELLFRCPMPHTSIMVRPRVLAQFGYYPEAAEFRYAEDYELWSRATEVVEAANLPEVLVQWRWNSASVSSQHQQMQRQQMQAMSFNNIRRILGAEVSEQAFDDANALFRAAGGRDPQLPPARLHAAVALMDSLQRAFYGRYAFARSEIAAHRRRWYWIWGKHLLALSLRTRAGIATRGALISFGARYMLRLVATWAPGRSHPRPQPAAASAGVVAD